jgi:hypothetical protein
VSEPGSELVVAGVGEIVNLDDAVQCVNALAAVRDLEQQLREAKAVLTDAIVHECSRMGTKTLSLPSGIKAVVAGGTETIWDIEVLETLVDAGLPRQRFDEMVTVEVTSKVNAREADRIAGANEQYAEIVERAKTIVEKPRYVTLKRR